MKWFKVAEDFDYKGKKLKRLIYNVDVGKNIKKGDKGPLVEFPEKIRCTKPIVCVGDVFILGNTRFNNTCRDIYIENSVVEDCYFKSECSAFIKNSQISSVNLRSNKTIGEFDWKIIISDSRIWGREDKDYLDIINGGIIEIEKTNIVSCSNVAKIESYFETPIRIKNSTFENFGISIKTELSRKASINIDYLKYQGKGDLNILVRGETTITDTFISGVQMIFVKNASIVNCNLGGTVSIFGVENSNLSLAKSTFFDSAKIVVEKDTKIEDSIIMEHSLIAAKTPIIIKDSFVSGCARVENADLFNCIVRDKTIVSNVSIRYFEIKKEARVGTLITGEKLDTDVFYPRKTLIGGHTKGLYVIEKQSDFYMMKDPFDKDTVLVCLPKKNKYVLIAPREKVQICFESMLKSVQFAAKKVYETISTDNLINQIASRWALGAEDEHSIEKTTNELMELIPVNTNDKNFIENSLLFFMFSFFRQIKKGKGANGQTKTVLNKIREKSLFDIKNKEAVLDDNLKFVSGVVLDVLSKKEGITLPKDWVVLS